MDLGLSCFCVSASSPVGLGSGLGIMANPLRIALSDPHSESRPRFVVGGQAGAAASGDVKLYEWHRSVRPSLIGLSRTLH